MQKQVSYATMHLHIGCQNCNNLSLLLLLLLALPMPRRYGQNLLIRNKTKKNTGSAARRRGRPLVLTPQEHLAWQQGIPIDDEAWPPPTCPPPSVDGDGVGWQNEKEKTYTKSTLWYRTTRELLRREEEPPPPSANNSAAPRTSPAERAAAATADHQQPCLTRNIIVRELLRRTALRDHVRPVMSVRHPGGGKR